MEAGWIEKDDLTGKITILEVISLWGGSHLQKSIIVIIDDITIIPDSECITGIKDNSKNLKVVKS